MATLTIRNVGEDIKASIRETAARNGLSMEEELRRLLKREFLKKKKPQKDLLTLMKEKFEENGIDDSDYVELEIPPRNEYMTESPVDFSDHFSELEDEAE